MARLVLLLTTLVGCNAVLGNDRAVARDARYFDAPADAAFACPQAGSPPPELNIELHGVFVQPCNDFSLRGTRATATCFAATVGQVAEGPAEGPLTRVDAFPADDIVGLYDQPRLSPDGQLLYARFTDFVDLLEVRYAVRQPGDTWQLAGVAPIFATASDALSTIAPGPDGDHVLVLEGGTKTLREWVGGAGAWHEVRAQPVSEIAAAFTQVKLSLDGLRLVGHTMDGMYYSDRPTIDAPFRAAVPFPTAPVDLSGGVLTEDCGRLYVADLGEVFFAQQR
jgi:hypothetical protein